MLYSSKMYSIVKIRKTLSVFVSILFCSVIVFTAYPLNAQPGAAHPEDQARIHTAARFILSCFEYIPLRQEVTAREMRDHNIFKAHDSNQMRVGSLTDISEGSLRSDGLASCGTSGNNAHKNALDILGFDDPADFWVNRVRVYERLEDGNYRVRLPFQACSSSNDATNTCNATTSQGQEFKGNFNIPSLMALDPNDGNSINAMGHFNALATYNEKCVTTTDRTPPAVSVRFVNIDTGEIEELTHFQPEGINDNTFGYGYTSSLSSDAALAADTYRGVHATCEGLRNYLNEWAEIAATFTQAAIESGNIPGLELDVDGPDAARCENRGGVLAWIMCPIINGLASLSDTIFDKLILPFLTINPVNLDPNDNPVFSAWSSFRVLANILLVIFLLVAVFGQSIGGGMIDAYTAKKIIPRVVASAILINISIYIVALALDVTNIIGSGVSELLTAPFANADSFRITLSEGAAGLGLTGLIGAGAGIWIGGTTLLASAIPFLLLFVVMPLVLVFIAIMGTLILRTGLIYLLIMVSPIAFALYCLPNTEKVFKQWWSLLFKALILYPVVMVMFATASILAVILSDTIQTSGGGVEGAFSGIASVIVMMIPLFLIPKAFKLTGGALGSAYGTLSGIGSKTGEAIKGNPNDPNSLRNKTKRNFGGAFTRGRADFVRRNEKSASLTRRRLAKTANFGDVMSKEAQINKEGIERGNQVKSNGDDTYGRASTSIPLYLDRSGRRTTKATDQAGNAHARAADKNGNLLRTSLAGAEYTDDQYKKGASLYKTNGEKQFWMDYEATKVNTGETSAFKDNYLTWAQQEGFTGNETGGIYKGMAHSQQNAFKNLKYSGLDTNDPDGPRFRDVSEPEMNFNPSTGNVGKNDELVNDMYHKQGAYATGQLAAEDMERIYDIKEHMASTVQSLVGTDTSTMDAGQLSAHQAELENAQTRLAQIGSMEDTWAGRRQGSVAPGMATDQDGTPLYSGLQGGNQGLQDTFNRRAYREENGTRRLDKIDPQTGQRI